MSDTMLLSVAVTVFLMLAIGLGLTIWEFRRGQPRQDELAARTERYAPRGPER